MNTLLALALTCLAVPAFARPDAIPAVLSAAGAPRLGAVPPPATPPSSLPQQPLDPELKRGIRLIQSRVVQGDSAQAAAIAVEALGSILSQALPDVIDNLARRNVYVYLIPRNRKMTDLPAFASLRGKRTFDGRLWDDVRGEGYIALPQGGFGVAAGEENMTDGILASHYRRLYLLAHEFGHVVLRLGLPDSLRGRAERIYKDSMTRSGTGLGRYADSNVDEDFAQATAAYFGVGMLDSPDHQWGESSRELLMETQPQMYALMAQVYGPVRTLAND